ncbi:helix-turn-helix domain-containing protein [Paenibacillus sp. GCM10027627]|uniref:helix-turn-helix domain-containing protein n=1 Tax=unclassified Paenibacillus TaxID=185978 RepID=UPI003624B306
MNDIDTIGTRINNLRQEAGLTMDELAKRILLPVKNSNELKPTTSATISNIENGRNNPSADITIALSNFFNVSTDWILKGIEFNQSNRNADSYLSTSHIVKEDTAPYKPIPEKIITREEYNKIIELAEEIAQNKEQMKSMAEDFSKKFELFKETEVRLNETKNVILNNIKTKASD